MKDDKLNDFLEPLADEVVERINVRFFRPMLKSAFRRVPNAVEYCECNGSCWVVMKDGTTWQDYEFNDPALVHDSVKRPPKPFAPLMAALTTVDTFFRGAATVTPPGGWSAWPSNKLHRDDVLSKF
ncbi:MAG: hypothetical protein JSS66_05800 [Armatimonadetes bacterium]|nr:hypothetical protein [Armatimonadota bacterium]